MKSILHSFQPDLFAFTFIDVFLHLTNSLWVPLLLFLFAF